jgi:hypothetical protein
MVEGGIGEAEGVEVVDDVETCLGHWDTTSEVVHLQRERFSQASIDLKTVGILSSVKMVGLTYWGELEGWLEVHCAYGVAKRAARDCLEFPLASFRPSAATTSQDSAKVLESLSALRANAYRSGLQTSKTIHHGTRHSTSFNSPETATKSIVCSWTAPFDLSPSAPSEPAKFLSFTRDTHQLFAIPHRYTQLGGEACSLEAHFHAGQLASPTLLLSAYRVDLAGLPQSPG